jgi:Ca2+-transporting ATPase
MENHRHTKTIPEIFAELNTSGHGLSQEEAGRRLREHGLNKLPEARVDSLAVIFFRQFQSPLIYILLAASVIVFAMGKLADGSLILAVLLFNAAIGAFQEGKAQNTLLALKKFAETKATVLRDGKEQVITDAEVVPGDVLILQEGEKVPADARIILSRNLKVDESALTGESEPVHKIAREDMIFKATHVVYGSGKAIVVATGLNTAVGKIAKEIAGVNTEIPLKANIRYLSRLIIIAVAGTNAFLFLLGIISGRPVQEMFTTVVSLSVAIIPEGLPVVMTLVLATGVWRMSKRNALIKNLQAVEALGQARVIAVDKTGTITKNELVVRKVFTGGKMFEVGGVGYEPRGEISLGGNTIDPLNHPELLFAGKIAAFCANARVMFSGEEKIWRVAGDPTEAAMLVLSQKLGFHKEDLERESPLVAEIPFDYKLKYHASLHKTGNRKMLAVVGAPEAILGLSQKIRRGGENHPLSDKEKEELEAVFHSMSEEGLRIVALAETAEAPETLTAEAVHSLTFVGFLGMKDALRPEAADAVQKAAAAGIRVVMITGDHKITARAIAKEAGIWREGEAVLTGEDIDKLSDKELKESLSKTSVFARVTPEHKLRIIKAYEARGEVIAMTGDGVNDAPSLVAADLGVGMGKIGTEVAKEASDIVLLDDNFGSIVSAVEEGRSIYKTIKKVITYLFAGSWSQVIAIVFSLFLGLPLPLLAAQIIWLNFVTDGFLTSTLAMEPKEEGLLRGNFERPKKYLIDKPMVRRIALMTISPALGTLILFSLYYQTDMAKAWTIALTTLAVSRWFNVWNCRHESKSIFQMNPLSNIYLVAATIVTICLQMLAIYHPVMQGFLSTTSLGLAEWLMIMPVAASLVLIEEVRKLFYRRKLSRIGL